MHMVATKFNLVFLILKRNTKKGQNGKTNIKLMHSPFVHAYLNELQTFKSGKMLMKKHKKDTITIATIPEQNTRKIFK